MKIAFIVVLIFNFLLESLAAVSLIGGPAGISAAGSGEQWSMHYGFAALAIASIGLWVWPHRSNVSVVTAALGVLLTFHTGIAISLTLAGDQAGGMIAHVLLATSCLFLFVQRAKICAHAPLELQHD